MEADVKRDRKANILVYATYFGDKKTAEHFQVSDRTVRNYRKELETDDVLAALFLQKSQEFSSSWVEDVAATIKVGVVRLQELFQTRNPKEAELIKAIAEAIKVLGDLNITHSVLNEPADNS